MLIYFLIIPAAVRGAAGEHTPIGFMIFMLVKMVLKRKAAIYFPEDYDGEPERDVGVQAGVDCVA